MGILNDFSKRGQHTSSSDQFLEELQSFYRSGTKLFFPGMTNPVFTEFNKVDDGTVELTHIHAEIIGQGDGTLALQGINELADQHGVQVVALAGVIADADSYMDDEALQVWYESQGFEETEGFEHLMDATDYRVPMLRKPKA